MSPTENYRLIGQNELGFTKQFKVVWTALYTCQKSSYKVKTLKWYEVKLFLIEENPFEIIF